MMKIAPVSWLNRFVEYLRGVKFSSLGLARGCLMVFLFVFPFQIRTIVYNEHLLLGGGFNIFQTGFVYLGDILILVALLLVGIAYWKGELEEMKWGERRVNILLGSILLLMLVSIIFASLKMVAIVSLLRWIILGGLYVLVCSGILTLKEIVVVLALSVVFQSVIAILQFILQGSLGLRVLGESIIGPGVKGVAKIDVNGAKLVRSYGTFAHPNILAGFFVVFFWMIIDKLKKERWMVLAIVLLITALVFSFSRSAFIALVGAGLTYYAVVQKKIDWKYPVLVFSLLILIVTAFDLGSVVTERLIGFDNAVSERFEYMTISKKMAFTNPMGVGLGNFTSSMQDYVSNKLFPWTIQPVHSVYLLVVNELGIVGLLVFGVLLYYVFSQLIKCSESKNIADSNTAYALIASTMAILIVSLFDHYFWTLYSGQVIFVIYLSVASSFLSRFKLPARKS